jgi:hypothetical protein
LGDEVEVKAGFYGTLRVQLSLYQIWHCCISLLSGHIIARGAERATEGEAGVEASSVICTECCFPIDVRNADNAGIA